MSLRKAIDNRSLHAVRPVSKPKKKTNGKVPDGLKRWQDERKLL